MARINLLSYKLIRSVMTKTKLAFVLAAVMCVFATSATAASAAKFTSSVTKEAVVGSGGTQIFKVNTSEVKCSAVSGESAATTFPTEQLVSSVSYTGCEVSG